MKSPYLLLLLIFTLFQLLGCSKKEFETGPEVKDYFTVKSGDYHIPVLVRGNTASKKILLFIQGGPGNNSLDFAETDYPGWKSTLEKHYAIAYYDQRGTGNREGNFSIEKMSMKTYTDDLHQVAMFLKSAYEAEIIMMGHSFGGHLMYRYILQYHTGAVPVSYISLNGMATSDSDTIRWDFRRQFLLNTANLNLGKGKNAGRWNEVLNWLNDHPEIKSNEEKDQWNAYVEELVYEYYPERSLSAGNYFKAVFSTPYNPVAAYLNGNVKDKIAEALLSDMKDYNLINKISAIDKKILIITGRYDDVCPPEESTYIFNNILSANKKLQIIEDAGHECFNHQPVEFQNQIINFIK